MKAEEFYEKQRQVRNTVDITENPDPDYSLPFYQTIFWLMEEYAQSQLPNNQGHHDVEEFYQDELPKEGEEVSAEEWAADHIKNSPYTSVFNELVTAHRAGQKSTLSPPTEEEIEDLYNNHLTTVNTGIHMEDQMLLKNFREAILTLLKEKR